MWTGFVRFRSRLGTGCFDYGNEMKFIKIRSFFFSPAEWLHAQELILETDVYLVQSKQAMQFGHSSLLADWRNRFGKFSSTDNSI